MPVAEPAGELWPLVKAQSGWPETDEDRVRALAGGWRGQGESFAEAGRFDVSELAGAWPDAAGQAFQGRTGAHLGTAARTGADMAELSRRAEAYAGHVAAVKTAIVDLIAANMVPYRATEPAFKGRFVQQVAVMVNGLLDQGAGMVGAVGGPPLGRAEPPPPGTDPNAVRTWWQGQPGPAQEALIAEAPDQIRNLDGIPADVRDRANRAVLDREIAALTEEKAALDARVEEERAQGTGIGPRGAPPGDTPATLIAQADAVQAKIDGLEALRPAGDRLLLGLDTAGDGRAIVAVGNPDTAADVATVVPGTYAGLASIGDEITRAEAINAAAGGPGGTATIAWVGYDAPDSILPEAAYTGFADDGSADLARFQDGLRATHDGPPAHQTVVAHSYGTVLVGHTARDHGLNADDVILVASPGTGTEHVSEFKLDGVPPGEVPNRVHTLTGADDPIRDSHLTVPITTGAPFVPPTEHHLGHGLDPTDPDWGAQRILAENKEADQHSGYFKEGTEPLAAIGGIIAGR